MAAKFIATIKSWLAQISAANTARDGTGTLVDVVTAGASGARVETIDITAAGTTTAGMIRLFIHDGTTTRLWMEIPVQAKTPSATVEVWSTKLTVSKLLTANYKIKAATHNAETFNIVADGGDF